MASTMTTPTGRTAGSRTERPSDSIGAAAITVPAVTAVVIASIAPCSARRGAFMSCYDGRGPVWASALDSL